MSSSELKPGSLRELLHVAVPLVISAGSITLMNFIDRVILTWYSTDALAAAMPAGLLHWTVMCLAFGTSAYVNTFVAQYEGAKRPERVAASIWQGIYLAIVASGLLLFVLPFTNQIFHFIGHASAVREMESQYFYVLSVGTLAFILSNTLSCFFTGVGRTRVVMIVNVISAVTNIVFDLIFVFGWGPVPALGIAGAALATVLAKSLEVALYIVLMSNLSWATLYEIWKNRRFDRELFWRLVRYGSPNGLMFLADVGAFQVLIILVGRLGEVQLASTNLAFNLNSLAFVPMFGISTAVLTLVGKRVGEGRPQLAIRTTWIAFGFCSSYMLFFSALYLLIPDLLMLPYAMEADEAQFSPIRDQAVILLRFVAVYAFFDAMAIVFGSAVRGAGDTRFSLIFCFCAGWILMVLPTVIYWQLYGGHIYACWTACTVYILALGVGFMLRFRAGAWLSMRVIEPQEALPFILNEEPSESGTPSSSVEDSQNLQMAMAEPDSAEDLCR